MPTPITLIQATTMVLESWADAADRIEKAMAGTPPHHHDAKTLYDEPVLGMVEEFSFRELAAALRKVRATLGEEGITPALVSENAILRRLVDALLPFAHSRAEDLHDIADETEDDPNFGPAAKKGARQDAENAEAIVCEARAFLDFQHATRAADVPAGTDGAATAILAFEPAGRATVQWMNHPKKPGARLICVEVEDYEDENLVAYLPEENARGLHTALSNFFAPSED